MNSEILATIDRNERIADVCMEVQRLLGNTDYTTQFQDSGGGTMVITIEKFSTPDRVFMWGAPDGVWGYDLNDENWELIDTGETTIALDASPRDSAIGIAGIVNLYFDTNTIVEL
tara:strand:+ start:463 stop:807 length:345 start_codon:yes stop_codon:yes gene_type:complete